MLRYHLSFETSCDDTSVAVFEGPNLLSLVTYQQLIEHNITGGVVPEVAARLHADAIFRAVDEALEKSGVSLREMCFISCTDTPGLVPSLLIGKTVAQTLARALKIPFLPLNHIRGHIFANLLERKLEDIVFPIAVLTVSGGHNELHIWHSLFNIERVGATQDDAAGEAFDKVSKMIGGTFPGGAYVSALAKQYLGEIPRGYLPVPILGQESLDFSFSGLKSAVKRKIDAFQLEYGVLTEQFKQEICAAFEGVVVEVLTKKLITAAVKYQCTSVALAGGVSANDTLCSSIQSAALQRKWQYIFPVKKQYSMDNAAMIGILGWYTFLEGEK